MKSDRVVFVICKVFIVVMSITLLTGCVGSILGDALRDDVKIRRVDVERYDPKTGRPRKTCRIVDKREIEVEYTAADGTTWTEKHSLEGGNWSPPALPDVPKEEPKAEVVPTK